MKNFVKVIIAMLGAEVALLTGEINTIFKALILLMIIDYLTGITKAIHEKKLDSSKSFFGIMKKVFIILIIIVAQQIDLIFLEQGIKLICRDTVIIFYVINEIISIFENTGEFIPIPDKLKEVLEQLKSKNKE